MTRCSLLSVLLLSLCGGAQPRWASSQLSSGSPGFREASQLVAASKPDNAGAILVANTPPEGEQDLHILLGHTLVLRSTKAMRRVYVSDPSTVTTFSPNKRELVLTAVAAGHSGLVVWYDEGSTSLYSVSADLDPAASRQALRAMFPAADISVEGSEGRLYISGMVPSDAASAAAAKLAAQYARTVVNTLQITPEHSKQVKLRLRIVEVDRARAEQFGINFLTGGGRTASSVSTQQFSTTVDTSGVSQSQGVSVSDPLNIFLYNYKLNFGLTVKDLESKQILQVLAEPTLTTISGVPARFLSGGEVPIPVVQGGTGNSTALTIVYKPYGVKVDFLPVVNTDGTIHLKVCPEVSALDYTNAVTLAGTTVPALSTRRAETEVEIRDGQSFIVSGLLDHRTTDALASTPGIAKIPLLGQLFRSKNLNHSVVELAVLVTASIVDPIAHPETTQEPQMVVPEIDSRGFDESVRKTLKTSAPAGPKEQPAAVTPQPVAEQAPSKGGV